MNKILIVIDAQEDFVYGPLGTAHAIQALSTITKAVEFATDNNMKIVYTRDSHVDAQTYLNRQEGRCLPVPHCINGTKGWSLCREVLPRNFDKAKVIDKINFGTTEWRMHNECFVGKDEIWICGFCTDICVMANFQIIKALYPEVPIAIISDACAGTTKGLHESALDVMRSCQARIATLEYLEACANADED